MPNDKTEALLTQLAEGVGQLRTSDGWQRWLAVQARFHRYSFGNCILIWMQRPDASQVAGFHKWLELGRHVNAGEHGIRILAPCVVKKHDEETDQDQRQLIGFRPATVFDVAQTSGAELPAAPMVQRLNGEAPAGLLPALLRFAHREGCGVEFVPQSELGNGRNGVTHTATGQIEVSCELSPAMTCKTLTHEIGHALMHGPEFSGDRSRAELEAESVAYLVMQRAGIDSAEYSFGYVANWTRDESDPVKAIQASGQRIVKAAQRIGDALEEKQAQQLAA